MSNFGRRGGDVGAERALQDRVAKFVMWMCSRRPSPISATVVTFGALSAGCRMAACDVRVVSLKMTWSPWRRVDHTHRRGGAHARRAGPVDRNGAPYPDPEARRTAACSASCCWRSVSARAGSATRIPESSLTNPSDLSSGNAIVEPCGADPIAHPEYLVQLETKRRGPRPSTTISARVVDWRRASPRLVLKTNASAYLAASGGRALMFSSRTPPFQMTTEKAVLVRMDCPGRSRGLPQDSRGRRRPTSRPQPERRLGMYWIVAAVADLGLSCW